MNSTAILWTVNSIVDSLHIDNSNLINFYNNNTLVHVDNRFKFHTVDVNRVNCIIGGIDTNAVGVDGISIRMVKMCLPLVTPFIAHIINECLRLSVFPTVWKEASVIPLPKINHPGNFSDLRPLSICRCLLRCWKES